MTKEDIRLKEMMITLRTRLLVMCAETSLALENTQHALGERDIAKATAVIEGDKSVNALENEIDERALYILVRDHPMAQDLRFVLSALRIVTDLERICDEAVSISEHVMLMQGDSLEFSAMRDIVQFMQGSRKAVDATIEAFRNNDSEKARQLSHGDADALQEEVRVLQLLMAEFRNPSTVLNEQVFMHLILVVHSLTRIWRRSVNFAEQICFALEGVNLKHADKL